MLNNVIVEQEFSAILQRFELVHKGLISGQASIMSQRQVDAERFLRIFARPDVIGRRARFYAQSTLSPAILVQCHLY